MVGHACQAEAHELFFTAQIAAAILGKSSIPAHNSCSDPCECGCSDTKADIKTETVLAKTSVINYNISNYSGLLDRR